MFAPEEPRLTRLSEDHKSTEHNEFQNDLLVSPEG